MKLWSVGYKQKQKLWKLSLQDKPKVSFGNLVEWYHSFFFYFFDFNEVDFVRYLLYNDATPCQYTGLSADWPFGTHILTIQNL